MDLTLWAAFAVASAIIIAIPGPTIMMVVAHGLAGGRRAALAAAPGVALGDVLAMSVSLAGAGAILAASATAFTVLKLAGAAYLICLGIGLWRNPPSVGAEATARQSLRRVFWSSFVVTALNPKGIVFFIAFVPQFANPAEPLLPQFAIMTATFTVLGALNALLWTVAAGTLRARLTRPAAMRRLGQAGGTCLIGAGALTALTRAA